MWNEILNDLWRVYRGRLLGSVFGLFIGAMLGISMKEVTPPAAAARLP